ncbi:50S ribosomal protein L15 [archaeon]|jgi:large subunit ribosomal protein L15|nr:50S ribosomal protein L15 [archaeon]MBT6697674.1 50S ribosomal protein L15 [archaeon]
MVVRKTKKVTKYRGSHYHGAGHRKKRRGAGSRGGRGNAGSGKRAGQKKAGIGNVLGARGGKRGFTSHHNSVLGSNLVGVNMSYFDQEKLENLVLAGKAKSEGGVFSVDLKALKFGKLLGSGKIVSKVKFLNCATVSKRAQEKVEAAGGSVSLIAVKTVKVSKSKEESTASDVSEKKASA